MVQIPAAQNDFNAIDDLESDPTENVIQHSVFSTVHVIAICTGCSGCLVQTDTFLQQINSMTTNLTQQKGNLHIITVNFKAE